MKSIILYDGREINLNGCIGCEMYDEKIGMSQAIVYQDDLFTVAQDVETPIYGFLVISSKRHVRTLNDLTTLEQQRLFELIVKTRRGLKTPSTLNRFRLSRRMAVWINIFILGFSLGIIGWDSWI